MTVTLPPVGLPATPVKAAPTANEGLSPDRTAQLRQAAIEFESVFLAEMLSHAGLGKARETFGGGVGEEAFGSLLAREQASALATSGGIGLAEHVFRALARAEGGR